MNNFLPGYGLFPLEHLVFGEVVSIFLLWSISVNSFRHRQGMLVGRNRECRGVPKSGVCFNQGTRAARDYVSRVADEAEE